jgi:hypothetical protein
MRQKSAKEKTVNCLYRTEKQSIHYYYFPMLAINKVTEILYLCDEFSSEFELK